MLMPTNFADYQKRFSLNQKITGHGSGTTMSLPCPFCAAPDWCVYTILEVQSEMAKEHVCTECGRGAKALFSGVPGGGTSFEVVQTKGDDQPEWLTPKMRRV